MPKIHGIGKLDWCIRNNNTPIVRNKERIRRHLEELNILYLTLWPDNTSGVCDHVETVNFRSGKCVDIDDAAVYDFSSVRDYETKFLKSRFREIARFLSTLNSTVIASVSSVEESCTQIDYELVRSGDAIRLPTKLILSLCGKINKWVECKGLSNPDDQFIHASGLEHGRVVEKFTIRTESILSDSSCV